LKSTVFEGSGPHDDPLNLLERLEEGKIKLDRRGEECI